jgi:PAS domain S-box-containing protein
MHEHYGIPAKLALHTADLRRQIASRQPSEIQPGENEDSAEQFRAYFEQAAVGMAHVSLDGTLLRINQRFCDILGYNCVELQGLTCEELTVPEDLALELDQCRRLLEGELSTFTLQERLIRKDRSQVWVNLTMSLVRNACGEPIYFLAVVEDITAWKQTEAALQQSRDELETILASVDDAIIVMDRNGKHVYSNESLARIIGDVSPLEFLNLPAEHVLRRFEFKDELGVPFSADDYRAMLARQGQASEKVLRFRLERTGEERCIVVRVNRTLDVTGEVRLVIMTIRDITERKSAEQEHAKVEALREIDRLKSEFIAGVSHELRTPLHHIKGFASTLLRRNLDFDQATVQEYLQIISEESDRLAQLIGDLLNTSQIEAGKLELEIDSIDVAALVRTTVRRWQNLSPHQFELMIPKRVPVVLADAHRIEQVLDNLLANVVRHTPANTSAKVAIEVTRADILVSIRDQGPGIDAQHLPFIFDRFYRAGARSGSARGAGLGLYISKSIVEQHGGRIVVETAPGAGTTFRFSLPRHHRAGWRQK